MPRNKSEQRPPGPDWLIDALLAHRALKEVVEANHDSFNRVRVDTEVPAIKEACLVVREADTEPVNDFFDRHPRFCNTWQDHLDVLEEEAKKYASKQKRKSHPSSGRTCQA